MIGKMNWSSLLGYTVQPSDMNLFQTYIDSLSKSLMAGVRTQGILFGGRITTVSGMQLQVSAGAVLMPDGQLITFPQTNFVIPTANPSNPRIDRIELAYTPTNNTGVSDITGNALVLDILYVPSVNINQGTAAATPAAPFKTSANISLGYVSISASQSSILLGNISQDEDVNFESSAIHLGNKSAFIRFSQVNGLLQYSNDGVRYSSFASGGGGGGGGANWTGVDGVAPDVLFEYGEKSLSFAQGQLQAASLWIKIPSGYLSGSPIKMKVSHYSPSATNNFKFIATATLVRKNLDAVTSTANQRPSTNLETVNTLANQYIEQVYDLSSAAGIIGSLAVSPGDLILVQLQRVATVGTEDSGDVRMIPSSTEVLFS
jgi:hypothetical protein